MKKIACRRIANPGSTSAFQMGYASRRISFVTVHTIVQTSPTKVIVMFVTQQNTSNVEWRRNAFPTNSDAMENTIAVTATIRTRIFAGLVPRILM
jgi:hypothetical protein